MAITTCNNCGGLYYWDWTEAFCKFGFNDGDGQVETWLVADVLQEAGYIVECTEWVLHNTIIASIKKEGVELLPLDAPDFELGYDDPMTYLPAEIIRLLESKLPDVE